MQDSFNMLKVNQEKAKNMKTVSDLVKDMVLSIWADDIDHDHGWFQNPSKPSKFICIRSILGNIILSASESWWREADIGHVTIKIAGVTAAGGEISLIWAHLIWWLTSSLYLGMMHAFNTNPGKMFMFNVTLRKKKTFFLVHNNIYNRRLVGITLMYTF